MALHQYYYSCIWERKTALGPWFQIVWSHHRISTITWNISFNVELQSTTLRKKMKQVWPTSFDKMQWQAGRNMWIKNQLIHKSDESNAGICNAFVYICFFLKRKFEIWASFQWVLHRKIEENTILLLEANHWDKQVHLN